MPLTHKNESQNRLLINNSLARNSDNDKSNLLNMKSNLVGTSNRIYGSKAGSVLKFGSNKKDSRNAAVNHSITLGASTSFMSQHDI